MKQWEFRPGIFIWRTHLNGEPAGFVPAATEADALRVTREMLGPAATVSPAPEPAKDFLNLLRALQD